MENRENKPTKTGFEMEMGIEMSDLKDKHCENRQVGSFPGSAKRLSTDSKVSPGEVDKFQVTRNLLSFQPTDEKAGNDIDVAGGTFDLPANCSGSESGQRFTTDSLDTQEDKGDIHDTEDADVTADRTYFLQKFELQFKHSSEQEERQRHATPKKPTPRLRRDDLYMNAVWGENQHGFQKTPDQRYFIAKHKSPVKSLSDKQDPKRDSIISRLDFTQAFVHPRKRNTISDEEYWRKNVLSRDQVASEESFLEQGVPEAKHQWYRSKETRPDYSHSSPITNLEFWFIILALIMIIITVALVVAVWKYLQSILS